MCDSLVVRGQGSSDGATLFAKNSDRRGREPQPFVQFPAAFHARGSRVRCTHLEIDQVAETYRVMGHSPDWCWGFEQGVNENGVAIGNQAIWTRDPGEIEPGLIGMDLVRLGLERGRSAREALEVIASLLEAHGQGGSAFSAEGDAGYQNSFMIADAESAWVLETTARSWAAKEVESASLTNELSLDAGWQIGSRQLERNAANAGLWNQSGRLDFRSAFMPEDWPSHWTKQRVAAGKNRLAQPALTVRDVFEWMRDHGVQERPRRPDEDAQTGAGMTVCMHADPISTTTASLAMRIPSDRTSRPWPVFVSFATPCSGMFMPVYLDGVIPGLLASTRMWEAMRRLQERAARDWDRSLPWLRDAWQNLEREVEFERRDVEEAAASAFAQGDRDAGGELLTAFMDRVAERICSQATEFALAL